jgi:hypothetical protein
MSATVMPGDFDLDRLDRLAAFEIDDDLPADEPIAWLSAAAAKALVTPHFDDENAARKAIAGRALAGMLGTRASLLIVGDDRRRDIKIPDRFWFDEAGPGMDQNWASGDFAISLPGGYRVRAYGTQFNKSDIQAMIPADPLIAARSIKEALEKSKGGRPMSKVWPEWIAEVVLYLRDEGYPVGQGDKGADELIAAVDDRLEARKIKAPVRSTVQPATRAILARLRAADNQSD